MSKMLKIATFNANSISVRLEHILNIINVENIDILAVQETKTPDNNFPIEAIIDAGFHVIFNGQKTYNGTCIISREKLDYCAHHLPELVLDYQRRFLVAQYGDIKIINCYVPNGSEVGSEKYIYKLAWLDALISYMKTIDLQQQKVVLLGDFNIAPTDIDVYDAIEWQDKISCSPAERERLQSLIDLGLTDAFRIFNQQDKQFSWWDYRNNDFTRNIGHRIDLILVSDAIKANCKSCIIDSKSRSWERPSDHAPVIAEFN